MGAYWTTSYWTVYSYAVSAAQADANHTHRPYAVLRDTRRLSRFIVLPENIARRHAAVPAEIRRYWLETVVRPSGGAHRTRNHTHPAHPYSHPISTKHRRR